jgi:hypothetical protein
MEQKYAESESIKYVIGRNREANLILNAGRIEDILLERDATNGRVIEYPMTFPIMNMNEQYGISHMQYLISAGGEDLNSNLRKYLRPIGWVCGEDSRKFFYFPLTSFYRNGEIMGDNKIPLQEIYGDNINDEVTWNLKRVMLRYNFNINISFLEDTKATNNFINIFYIQYTSSTARQADDDFFQ